MLPDTKHMRESHRGFLPSAADKAEERDRKRGGSSTLGGAIGLCKISTAAMAAADSGRGVGYAASGPMFDLPAGMSVSQQETHISLYAVRLIYVFNSATHQTVHFSFDLPEMPVDAKDRKSTRLNSSH